jgi:methionyl-tRNA synthetase
MQENPNYINIDDFIKVDLRIGQIITVEEVLNSDKLYKLSVDFGEEKYRTVFSGIKNSFTKDDLLNKQFVFVINLEPRKIMGEYSEAMILAGSDNINLALMSPTTGLKNGSKLN